MMPCRHKHTGRMTAGDLYGTGAMCSMHVCDREECQTKARRFVQGETGKPGIYFPFEKK